MPYVRCSDAQWDERRRRRFSLRRVTVHYGNDANTILLRDKVRMQRRWWHCTAQRQRCHADAARLRSSPGISEAGDERRLQKKNIMLNNPSLTPQEPLRISELRMLLSPPAVSSLEYFFVCLSLLSHSLLCSCSIQLLSCLFAK